MRPMTSATLAGEGFDYEQPAYLVTYCTPADKVLSGCRSRGRGWGRGAGAGEGGGRGAERAGKGD